MSHHTSPRAGRWSAGLRRLAALAGAAALAVSSAVAVTAVAAEPDPQAEPKPLALQHRLVTDPSKLIYSSAGEKVPVTIEFTNPNPGHHAAFATSSGMMGIVLPDGSIHDGTGTIPDPASLYYRLDPGKSTTVTYEVVVPDDAADIAGLDEIFTTNAYMCKVGNSQCSDIPPWDGDANWTPAAPPFLKFFVSNEKGQVMNVTAQFRDRSFSRVNQEVLIEVVGKNPLPTPVELEVRAGEGQGVAVGRVTFEPGYDTTQKKLALYHTTQADFDAKAPDVRLQVVDPDFSDGDPRRVVLDTTSRLQRQEPGEPLSIREDVARFKRIGDTIYWSPIIHNASGTYLNNMRLMLDGEDYCPMMTAANGEFGGGDSVEPGHGIACNPLGTVTEEWVKAGTMTKNFELSAKTHYFGKPDGPIEHYSHSFAFEVKKQPTVLAAKVTSTDKTFRLPGDRLSAAGAISNTGDADAWVTVDASGTPVEVGLLKPGATAEAALADVTATGADVTRGYVDIAATATDTVPETEAAKDTLRIELDAPLKFETSHNAPPKVAVGDIIRVTVGITNDVDVRMVDGALLLDGEPISSETFTLDAGETTDAYLDVEITKEDLEKGEIALDLSVTATPESATAAAMSRVDPPATRATADTFTLQVEPVVVPLAPAPAPTPSPNPSGGGASTAGKGSVSTTGAQVAGVGVLAGAAMLLGMGLVRTGRLRLK